MEWAGNENKLEWEWEMKMKFQCLLDKNKWEWWSVGMRNENKNQFTKLPIVLIINKNN